MNRLREKLQAILKAGERATPSDFRLSILGDKGWDDKDNWIAPPFHEDNTARFIALAANHVEALARFAEVVIWLADCHICRDKQNEKAFVAKWLPSPYCSRCDPALLPEALARLARDLETD